jgi:copper chaperone NosL
VVLVGLVIGLGLVTAACGGDSDSGPPEIVEGRTQCDECQMVIDDVRFAASYRLGDGTEKTFDDIGDMLAQGQREGELAEAEIWVYDRESGEPIPAEEASYVVSGGSVETPMGWGVVAFTAEEAAHEAAASAEARVVDWAGLLEVSAGGEVGAHLETGSDEPADPETGDTADMSGEEMPEGDHDDHTQ